MKRLSTFLSLAIVALAANPAAKSPTAAAGIAADPDFISTGIAWTPNAIPTARAGDGISWKRFSFGAMLEAANEERFDQEFFPNHRWRGVVLLNMQIFDFSPMAFPVSLHGGLKHESAHPTMGIRENTAKAHEMIYDGLYRRMILNSADISVRPLFHLAGLSVESELAWHFYFLSKNTPELEGPRLAWTNGLTGGLQGEKSLSENLSARLSLHGRLIFRARRNDRNFLYSGQGTSLSKIQSDYPVIQGTRTFVLKGGLAYGWGNPERRAGLFARILAGNPYGFFDSRDKRVQVSLGLEFW